MELFSPGHLLVLVVVVTFLFFGWKQLPDMSRSLGRSLRVFKTEIKGMNQDDRVRDEQERSDAATPPPATPRAIAAPAAAQVVTPVVPAVATADTTAGTAVPSTAAPTAPSTAAPSTAVTGSDATVSARPRPAPRPGVHSAARNDG